jgi:hypothetical protein
MIYNSKYKLNAALFLNIEKERELQGRRASTLAAKMPNGDIDWNHYRVMLQAPAY